MSTSSEPSAQGSQKLQSLTVEALKADKASQAAKRKAGLAKAALKVAKKQLKTAKANLKEAKKAARKAAKKAKDAKKGLQAYLERADKERKKSGKSPAKLKGKSTGGQKAKAQPAALTPISGDPN
jgi:hypothetical protein